MMAVPFDPNVLEPKGSPAVVEGVMVNYSNGAAQFSVSDLGSLAYIPGTPWYASQMNLVWVDRHGAAQPLPAPPRPYAFPRLSPDGHQVALSITQDAKSDIWIYDLSRDTLTPLTSEGISDFPLWALDGKRVACRSARVGLQNIFWKPADGSGPEDRLTTTENLHSPHSFFPDGKTLLYHEQGPTTSFDLWALPLEGERKPRLFLQTRFAEVTPRFSPDGRWLAYLSDESGRFEVYVRPYPGPGAKYPISTEGGSEISWGQNGELFYRTGANLEKMMVVDTQTQPGFSAGKPRLLFDGPYASEAPNPLRPANYSVSADGQRFLMLQAKDQQQTTPLTQINIVLNWFEELKRKAPVK